MPATADSFKNYIGGEWSKPESGEYFENFDPATGELLNRWPAATDGEVDRAVSAAAEALQSWRLTPAPKRGELLYRAGEILLSRKKELSELQTREMGKLLRETSGDVQEGIDMVYYAAGEGRRQWGHTTPSELPDKFMMSVRMPIGVIGVITPWNFPLAIPTWKIFPALVLGNTLVFKPSRFTPHSAYEIVRALEEAGLPKGVINILYGPAALVGNRLVEDERVEMVTFTGSTAVGRELGVRCAAKGKRFSAEMGGKNAILLCDDGDIELAVDAAVWSAFGTTGQRCTAASRLVVQKGVLPEFQKKLVQRTKALRLGHGLEPTTDVGPLNNEGQLRTVENYMETGKKEAKLLCGGSRAAGEGLQKGWFFQPTIFGDVAPDAVIAQEEIFGPVTAIIPVDSFEEGIEVVNGTRYGLVASCITADVNRAFAAMRDINTGLLYINSGTIGAEVHLPFGGTKQTGNGHREAGPVLLDTFSEWKSIFVDHSGGLQKAQGIE